MAEKTKKPEPMLKAAMIVGEYRYWLRRTWSEAEPACAFIMLNPSTADAEQDDNTIRRVMGFARSWGFGGVNVYNLFAVRSTQPDAIYDHPDPIGPDNNAYLSQIPPGVVIVAAWGVHGAFKGRAAEVRNMLRGRLSMLRATKHGHPEHPLYIPASQRYQPYPGPAAFELV